MHRKSLGAARVRRVIMRHNRAHVATWQQQETLRMDPIPAQPPRDSPDYPPPAQGWYVVVILTIAYVFSFLDRQILALLVEPIRQDLGISDTRMSLLLGMAFAIFYTLLGIPLGRLADRYSRRAIIAGGITIWCAMTVACGLARNYFQLFLARIGVGVGEATLNPCALSLISDYFPREKRGRAISFYSMGITLGVGIAMIIGGWVIDLVFDAPPIVLPVVGELYAWQTVFLVVGLPGLLVALLMATVREPARKGKMQVTSRAGTVTEDISIGEAIRFLARRWQTYSTHFLGMSVVTIIGYAYFFWIPTMFVRTWAWTIPQVAIVYGLVNLIVGPTGVNLGGWFADSLYQRGYKDGHMRACLFGALLFVPTSVLVPLMPTATLAFAMMIPSSIGGAIITATGAASLMMITPNQMRGQITALYYFVINILGLTLGPTAVALVTDYGFGFDGALRYSISIVSLVAGVLGLGFLAANLKFYAAAVVEAEAWK
jgi:MFS family permease